jgi:hypothetical protein
VANLDFCDIQQFTQRVPRQPPKEKSISRLNGKRKTDHLCYTFGTHAAQDSFFVIKIWWKTQRPGVGALAWKGQRGAQVASGEE